MKKLRVSYHNQADEGDPKNKLRVLTVRCGLRWLMLWWEFWHPWRIGWSTGRIFE